jgi:Ca-activated chloride channel family protein
VTDGYVGNDMEIIGEIQKHANARVFSFGIGSSVNRFLIEGMAKAGRGDSEVVSRNDKADIAAHRLYERLRSPLLTDVSISWGGLPVTDVYPKQLPDLFSGKPLVITGRYTAAASGKIELRGNQTGENIVREIPVTLTAASSQQNVLPSFWARRKIDDLMSQDWSGVQGGVMKSELQKQITQIGLDYRLMTQFTSFVAVEERVVTKDGVPQRVEVPVEMPEGVSYEGIFGDKLSATQMQVISVNGVVASTYSLAVPRKMKGSVSSTGAGVAGGMYGRNIPPGPPPPNSVAGEALDVEAASTPSAKNEKPTSERSVLESKLHPALLQAFDCWKKSGDQCKTVQDGKVQIQIFFTGSSTDITNELRALGFVTGSKGPSGKVLAGSLPIGKLPAMARLAAVNFVSLITR